MTKDLLSFHVKRTILRPRPRLRFHRGVSPKPTGGVMQIKHSVLAVLIVALALLFRVPALALAGGSLSGVIQDPTGALVPNAKLTLVNNSLKTQYQATSDARGFYSFPALSVGDYELTIAADGF